jgi:NAD(P)H-hydrate epimerase
MIPVLTPDEMRAVDRYTIHEVGIPGIVLMEHAGRALANHLQGRLRPGADVGVVCGKGNNGGDGLVAARFLAHAGHRVRVYLAADPAGYEQEAGTALAVARRAGLSPIRADTPESLSACDFSCHDWLVDALLGTGTRGAVAGHYADVIEKMNASSAPILACDLPSGLDAASGRAEGACVRARETLTIGFPKVGLLLFPGAQFTGALHVADIGFPSAAVEQARPACFLLDAADARERLPLRRRNAHKGDFGRALVLCGSRGMTGAAALTAEAALRVGAGLVTVGIPASLNDVLEAKLTEAMSLPLPDTGDGTLALAAEPAVRAACRRMDAIAVGSGISQHAETRALVRALLAAWNDMPSSVVLDADALNNVAPVAETGVRFPPSAILTPHPGEMARLLGDDGADAVESARVESARGFARLHGVVLVLKGVPTVVAAPDGRAFLNPTGNPGMATGGSGDVLTGIILGLLAQGKRPLDAALLGVYLHGFAGDLAAATFGAGLIAGDIVRALPDALRRLSSPGDMPSGFRKDAEGR